MHYYNGYHEKGGHWPIFIGSSSKQWFTFGLVRFTSLGQAWPMFGVDDRWRWAGVPANLRRWADWFSRSDEENKLRNLTTSVPE